MKKISEYLIVIIPAILLFSCSQSHKEAEKNGKADQEIIEEQDRELSPEERKWEEFLITRDEINLNYKEDEPLLRLTFSGYNGNPNDWKREVKSKFRQLIGFDYPGACEVTILRESEFGDVNITALRMKISDDLSIPAYLLQPAGKKADKSAVMAIHGHGRVEPAIGQYDDYHHKFAWELARDGHLVLAPELRGFSKLNDLAFHDTLNSLDYWEGKWQYTLATDGFLYGHSMVGETVEDLVRWENWLSEKYNLEKIDVCGISYGGDLAIYYPVFSNRVDRIFCSGSMGSFKWIFRSCYNAPAHCIPHVLNWMDRSDIAGLNYPSPIMIHYGEYDTPSPDNHSAAYNPSGRPAYMELKEIYGAFGNEDLVRWHVTRGANHEMDIPALLKFLD